ncbi:hypothetical protein F909_03649 [Acinetobacter sp. ANC 3929]|uniref:hypothetical protein n=1 Tax=Acinetobacter sp. ANC 3929 TaxID=1217707 RepID=UPI0002D01BE6|nr:hypothetical protein [Acinetobacter sp. ANC 3929]ENW78687.1 hypothetical protein F909_03649 [Acinetobacter sp. ANC 3929]
MKINLDNIQAEAQQIEEQIKLDTAQNEEIKKLLKKHENDLKKFFTDSFPKGSVSEGNGGRQLTAKFGEIEVSMYLVPLRYAENGTALYVDAWPVCRAR